MTKPLKVSDETPTDRFPHFKRSDSPVCANDSQSSPRRAGSGRLGVGVGLTSEVAVGVGGGGVFPETTLDFLMTFQTRPRPDPTPTSDLKFISCPPSDPPPARPRVQRAVLGVFISVLGELRITISTRSYRTPNPAIVAAYVSTTHKRIPMTTRSPTLLSQEE